MKILHVMNEDPKFPAWFFDFLLKNGLFDQPGTRHGFLCKRGGVFDAHVKEAAGAEIGSLFFLDYFPDRRGRFHRLRAAARIAELAPAFDKILFHWLDDKALLSLAYGEVARKSAWSLWGGDLYGFRTKKNRQAKDTLSEILKICLVRRLKQVCSLVREDAELAAEWYGANATWRQVFYPSEAYKTVPTGSRRKKEGGHLVIQVGNSANPTNRHLEVFEALSKVDFIEKIICPLSYGDFSYARKITDAGTRLFGEKFLPLTDFIAPPEYAKMLSSVDAAVMNHDRQQAIGNIALNLLHGNRVFLRKSVTTYGFFESLGADVFPIEDLLADPASALRAPSFADPRESALAVQAFFSDEHCKALWQAVFLPD